MHSTADVLRYHCKGCCITLAFQMLANNVPITVDELKKLLSKMKLLLMNNEDSLFNSDLIITSYLQGLGWFLQHDLEKKPEEVRLLILKFALDNASSFLLLPHQQVRGHTRVDSFGRYYQSCQCTLLSIPLLYSSSSSLQQPTHFLCRSLLMCARFRSNRGWLWSSRFYEGIPNYRTSSTDSKLF